MRSLAALLLVLVAGVHYGPDLLANGYADHGAARRAIYYVMRSFEGAMQYALIALLVLELALRQPEPAFGWRERAEEPARRNVALAIPAALVTLVCSWGIVEHLQAGACRLAIGIGNRLSAGQPLTGLCDDVLGWPMYALGLGAAAFIAAVIAAHSLGD